MLFAAALALLAASPAHMLGSIDNSGAARPLRVMTYEGAQVCTIKVADAGDHATLSAAGCGAAPRTRWATRCTRRCAPR